MQPLLRPLLSASAMALVLTQSALALDATAFADRFVQQFALQGGGNLAYSGVSESGDDITVEGVKIVLPEFEAEIGDVTFEGTSEADGAYMADRVTVPDFMTEEDDVRVSLTGLSMDGLTLPAPDGAVPSIMSYDRATLETLNVAIKGMDMLSMRNFITIVETNDDNTQMNYDSQVESFLFDLRATEPDGRALATAEALDLVTVAGSMGIQGSWTTTDGGLTLEPMRITIPGQGELQVDLSILGYTTQFIQALQQASEAAEAAGSDPQAAQGAQLAMLGLLQQLSYSGAAIRYVDEGFANRMLDYTAQQQGMDRQTMINQTKGVLPFVLAQLQKPEFVAQATAAVSAFLDDPQSFTITANPAAPVPAAVLTATGMTAPQNLIDQLNVQISAND